MDFTNKKYAQLENWLKAENYAFITYSDYCSGIRPDRFVIIRHDVDLKPLNSLRVAELENEVGTKATYYFRAVPESWDDDVIHKIHSLGHEIGYHYESLTTCNGDVDAAYNDFCVNLERLRKLAPVRTICMHGSPRSPYDSKDIWKKYDYESLGIIGEPYLSTDFSNVLYLTDTGRRWDGYKVSVRDKIEGFQEKWNEEGLSFHTTDDIIAALKENRLPNHIMLTTHPQRWCDFGIAWLKEWTLQNMKNIAKKYIVRKQKTNNC